MSLASVLGRASQVLPDTPFGPEFDPLPLAGFAGDCALLPRPFDVARLLDLVGRASGADAPRS